jgi:hypothetical protein
MAQDCGSPAGMTGLSAKMGIAVTQLAFVLFAPLAELNGCTLTDGFLAYSLPDGTVCWHGGIAAGLDAFDLPMALR